MSTYLIKYRKTDSIFLGDCGWVKVNVVAPDEASAIKCAQRFCIKPEAYTWHAKVKG